MFSRCSQTAQVVTLHVQSYLRKQIFSRRKCFSVSCVEWFSEHKKPSEIAGHPSKKTTKNKVQILGPSNLFETFERLFPKVLFFCFFNFFWTRRVMLSEHRSIKCINNKVTNNQKERKFMQGMQNSTAVGYLIVGWQRSTSKSTFWKLLLILG